MGHPTQKSLLRRLVPAIAGPVLEIGSKNHAPANGQAESETSSFRDVYAGAPYLGVDVEPGPGVDRVVDLAAGTGGLPENHFALAICCSVLEHTPRPWAMAANITRLLAPGGIAYVSVPWVWRFHCYPDDYFRFSASGVRALFDGVEWRGAWYSTNVVDELIRIDFDDRTRDDRLCENVTARNGATRTYLPYLAVNMIGTRRAAAAAAA
jgi:SAM-dependent methyltransferase